MKSSKGGVVIFVGGGYFCIFHRFSVYFGCCFCISYNMVIQLSPGLEHIGKI